MKKRLIAASILVSMCAHGEVAQVHIPGKHWGIRFDMPTISQYQGVGDGKSFQYKAVSAGEPGTPQTLLTLFLEPDASGSNKACFESYWAKSKQNPLIEASSVRTTSMRNVEAVHYTYVNGQSNANFYLVNQGYCIDVHVSLSAGAPEAEKTLTAIGESLRITSSP